MPAPLDIPADVRKIDGRWNRTCPQCDGTVSHLRRNYCVNASLLKQPCKRCSNTTNHPSGMVGPVRVAWFNSFYKSAISRGYGWDLTIEQVAALYELQGGRCALTGWLIQWSSQGWEHTASLDRIENESGYTLDNVQLVHKAVNMSRGRLSVNEFTEVCCAVADNARVVTS